jgi:NAD(P)-dependent dehydrogenase (short-subunit alcohol dehydrogenase family)
MSPTKTVLITGAGGDLGRAFTAVFAGADYAVAGLDVVEAALGRFSAAAEAAGGDHLSLACDLRDWSQIDQAVNEAARHFGRIDVVINNATMRTSPTMKPLEECSEAEYDNVLAAGPRAALGVMRAALPHLKRVRGTVINIGSGAGITAAAGLGPYGMSKAAMHALTRSAALEWGPHGITVNGILPLAMTDQLASVLANNPTLNIKTPPIGRMGDPERDIAAVALFLASPAADYISGQNISVDGGNS